MLSCFAERAEARDHVQVGPRAGARADRARAGHQLRRRADAELGPARVARASPSYDTSSLRQRRRRRRAGAARAREAGRRRASPRRGPRIGYGMTETNAYGPQNIGRRLRDPPDQHRPGARRSCEIEVRDDGRSVAAGRRARRDLVQGTEPDPRLLEQARGDRRDDRRRLAPHRRHRPHRRRRLRLRRGPGQGHGPARRRERLLRRGRGRDLRAPGGVRGRGVRRAPRAARRGGRGRRRAARRARRSRSEELQDHVRERLAPFKVPTRIVFFDEPLPRNAAGKILKRELRDDVTRSDAANPPSTARGSRA